MKAKKSTPKSTPVADPTIRFGNVVSVRVATDTFEAMKRIAAARRMKTGEVYRMACEQFVASSSKSARR